MPVTRYISNAFSFKTGSNNNPRTDARAKQKRLTIKINNKSFLLQLYLVCSITLSINK